MRKGPCPGTLQGCVLQLVNTVYSPETDTSQMLLYNVSTPGLKAATREMYLMEMLNLKQNDSETWN